MCGIFGWIARSSLAPNPERLKAGLDLLTHRGPDGQGTWIRSSLGFQTALGHRRLSIIDIEGGAQPLHSHDGRFVVTFNGEIYNYRELRDELRVAGHRFTTNSDTEVIVEGYRRWGSGCLTHFRGMFAFALYDLNEEQLFLARDAFGKKPLFYTALPAGLAFSSEIAPLFELDSTSRAIDASALAEYLVSRYAPGPSTLFAHIKKLPPGSFAIYKGGRLAITQYFRPQPASGAAERISYPDAVRKFGALLEDAVTVRMRSDAPFGVYLSGGLDSSVIAALMARQSRQAISTFSVGFEPAAFSELPFAQQVAKQLASNHHELVVRHDDFFGAWEAATFYRGAPVSEGADIPILLLSQIASTSVKMVLTGEGADELLLGYPKYQAERFVGAYQRVLSPALHARTVDAIIARLPPRFRRIQVLSRVLCEPDAQTRQRAWFGSLSPDAAIRLGATFEQKAPTNEERSADSPVRQLQLFDQTSWLPDNLLERGDRMMMGGSIEGRMPFMDVPLTNLVATFPEGHLLRHRRGKAILRSFARGLVDRTVIERPKVGFRVPTGTWFRDSNGSKLRDLICSDHSTIRRILHGPSLDTLVAEHVSGHRDHEKLLWTLASLEVFFRVYKPDISELTR